MEIFIIGGILVGIMVYASTRIKRSAAQAYKPETVEKDDFSIEKPEGFLYPLRDKPDFPFEAYSKLYGDKTTRNIWQARIRLRIHEGRALNRIVRETKKLEKMSGEKKLSDLPTNQKGIILRTTKTIDDEGYNISRKIVETPKNTYELRTTMLAPYADDYTDRICEMMKSFEIR